MPRTARASVGEICYHVLNRGNARATVFHKEGDYAAFADLLAAANERLPLRIPGYVLMPNHFHLALWRPRIVTPTPRPAKEESRNVECPLFLSSGMASPKEHVPPIGQFKVTVKPIKIEDPAQQVHLGQ